MCGNISTDAVAFNNSHFGAGIGTIHLNDIGCTGREANLTDCPQLHYSRHCFQNHSEDAGVRCQGLKINRTILFHLNGICEKYNYLCLLQ